MFDRSQSISSSLPPEAFDEVYLEGLRLDLHTKIRSAHLDIAHACDRFRLLALQPALAASQARDYQRMTDKLAPIAAALAALKGDKDFGSHGSDDYRIPMEPPPSAALIQTIKQTIVSVNAAEVALLATCRAAHAAARQQDPLGLLDWELHRFEYEFNVQLDAGPARAFYDECDDGDAVRIPIKWYVEREASDIDLNQFEPDSPFYGDHHGNLVHCLIEHSVIPLAMLPSIKEIEVVIRFYDCETAWQRSIVTSKPQPFGPMRLAFQAELFKRYPNAFRPPVADAVGDEQATVIDQRGVECGDGWFNLVDRMARATEREIERLIDAGVGQTEWPRIAQIKENSTLCGSTSTARAPRRSALG